MSAHTPGPLCTAFLCKRLANETHLCPLHAAAPELLKAAKHFSACDLQVRPSRFAAKSAMKPALSCVTWRRRSMDKHKMSADPHKCLWFAFLPRCQWWQESQCQRLAAVYLFSPDGKPNPGGWVCQEHADDAVTEYRDKLGERWTYRPLVIEHAAKGGGGMDKVQIVIAYTDMTGLQPTGRMVQRNMNWFPEYVAVETPKAAMWLRCGTREDVSKAEAYMAREHSDTRWAVYTFEKGHHDPLSEAKSRIIRAAKKETQS